MLFTGHRKPLQLDGFDAGGIFAEFVVRPGEGGEGEAGFQEHQGEMKHFRDILPAILLAVLSTAIPSCAGRATAPTAGPGLARGSTPIAAAIPPNQPGVSERRLNVQGQARTYLIHVPSGLDLSRPAPVVFVFHGFAESGLQALAYTGFDNLADTERFIAVYPNGTGLDRNDLSWNAGSCCGYAAIENVDESAFVRSILSDLRTMANVDPRRIYVTGFANGAMLSYRLGCEMSDVFAAMAPVAGNLSYYGPCQPEQPVSLIHIHGLGDKVIPYAGTSLPGFGEQYPPVSYGIATWTHLDGCVGPPRVSQKGAVTLTTYTFCRAGSAVELYTLKGFGHAWPEANLAGGISARTIWEFFADHPKP